MKRFSPKSPPVSVKLLTALNDACTHKPDDCHPLVEAPLGCIYCQKHNPAYSRPTPGSIVVLDNRPYQVFPDGSLRRLNKKPARIKRHARDYASCGN